MAVEHVARCVTCRTEYTELEFQTLKSGCSMCGSRGVMCDPRSDVTIKINPHELRILTIWASNWIKGKEAGAEKALEGILLNLRNQLPGIPLTLLDEMKGIADTLKLKVELVDHQGTVHVAEPNKGDA